MITVAIDTSGPVAGVAISRDGCILYEATANVGLTHSQTLMPMLDIMMKTVEIDPCDVDLFACVAGPGSFTGVRIGVCAIKALSQATEKPCLALDALEVLAAGAFGFPGIICPILDARRGQVYAAAFSLDATGIPVRLSSDVAMPLGEFISTLPDDQPLLFTGDGVTVHSHAIKQTLKQRALIAPGYSSRILAAAACFLAEQKKQSAGNARELMPIYLRQPQAERERAERLNHG